MRKAEAMQAAESSCVVTMKSVSSPVSSDSLLSDTISEEPGVIIAEIRSISSGGMMMRSSAAAGLDGVTGSASETLTGRSPCDLRPRSARNSATWRR